MRKAKILVVFLFFAMMCSAQDGSSYFSLTVTKWDGSNLKTKEIQGKKTWIVIAPKTTTADDSLFLVRVDSVSRAQYGKMLTVIVPAIEDGYDPNQKSSLSWLRKILNPWVIYTQPMYVRKAAGVNQGKLAAWLTHSSQNGHIDMDIAESGSMYFVSKDGVLLGSFGPEARFSDKILNIILSMN